MYSHKKWKIVIPDRVAPPAEIEESIFGERAKVEAFQAKDVGRIIDRLADADAILAWHDLLWDKEVLACLINCKVIVRVGAGFDNVDLRSAKERGIVVSNVPDYGTLDVADHTIALLLSLARGLNGYNRVAKTGQKGWDWGSVPSFRLTNRCLGIIGLGRIGTSVAMRAKSLGIHVGYYDPYRPNGWDKALGVSRFATLKELAESSDIISVHAPLTRETNGMLDEGFFGHVKEGSVFLNTARGPIVKWEAFKAAFSSGRIRCAGFDVLPEEPVNLRDSLLSNWSIDSENIRDRLIITPHCAFYSEEAVVEMRQKAALEALRVLNGDAPQNQVN